MDAGKGSRCSTNVSDDRLHSKVGGIEAYSFALGAIESCSKATQVGRNNLASGFGCKSSAALQSCWVQRLNLFHSFSDADEEVAGRKPPGKHIHVWSHFAKDFSSCRRPFTVSHSRSSSWPPDGPTVNEEVLRLTRLPALSASRRDSDGACNHIDKAKSAVLGDGNLLVPSEEATQSCGADYRVEYAGLGREKRSDNKPGSPREALVPCLQTLGLPLRTNVRMETLGVEDECKSQILATRLSVQSPGSCLVFPLNTPTGMQFSEDETRKHAPVFGYQSVTASPAVCRGDCHWKAPVDPDAKERVPSTFASGSKVENRGARADADGMLLVSPSDMRKNKVIGRSKKVATDVFRTVDAERLDLANCPVDHGENALKMRRTEDGLSSDRMNIRERSRKNVLTRSGICIDLEENVTDKDERVAENCLLFSQPCPERVWHGLSDDEDEKYVINLKTSVGSSRQHATVSGRSHVREAGTKGCWNDEILEFEDQIQMMPAESFSSTGSLPLDHFLEGYHQSHLKEAIYSKTNDAADRPYERMPDLCRPVKADIEFLSPIEPPDQLSHSRLWNENFTSTQEASRRMDLQNINNDTARIKTSHEPMDLFLPQQKWSPSSRCNDVKTDKVPTAQQAWIQRWSSFLSSGSLNPVRQASARNGKLGSDFSEKLLPSNCADAVLPSTWSHRERSSFGCTDLSSREHSKKGSRTLDGNVERADCGFNYILGSCLPTKNSQGEYPAPKAQAMAILGAARQMDISPEKKRVFLQTKGTPGNTSSNSGRDTDVDMDILEFFGS